MRRSVTWESDGVDLVIPDGVTFSGSQLVFFVVLFFVLYIKDFRCLLALIV